MREMAPIDLLFCIAGIVATLGAIGSAVFVGVLAQSRCSVRHRRAATVSAALQIVLLCGAPAIAWRALRSRLAPFGVEVMVTYLFGAVALACGTLAVAVAASNVVAALALKTSELRADRRS